MGRKNTNAEDRSQMQPHPLEHVVMDMVRKRELVDVTSVSHRLWGPGIGLVSYKQTAAYRKAYRIVACNLLQYMVRRGVITQHEGEFGTKLGEGGPCFSLAGEGLYGRKAQAQ